jgi:hypothetical protein
MILSGVAGVLVNITFLLYFPFLTTRVDDGYCIEPVDGHWEYVLSVML